MQEYRNCDGESNTSFRLRLFDSVVDRCPLPTTDPEAMELISIILLCEGGGMGGSRVLPSNLIEETVFYFNARGVVLSEKGMIEKIRDKRKKKD